MIFPSGICRLYPILANGLPSHGSTILASSFTPSSFDTLPFRFLYVRKGTQREKRDYFPTYYLLSLVS